MRESISPCGYGGHDERRVGALTIRRVSVHAVVDGRRRAHDVAVCADAPVADLLPELARLIGVDPAVAWRLERTAAADPIDDSVSLVDNAVHDGEVLVLASAGRPTPALVTVDAVTVIAGAADARSTTDLLEPVVAWLTLVAAATLGWAGVHSDPIACAVVAAACGAELCWRARTRGGAAAAVAGTLLVGAAGFLAVPGGPGLSDVMLGAAVTAAAAVVLARLTPRTATALSGTAVAAALVAAGAAVAVACALTASTAGAFVTTAAFALLAWAPRCAMAVAGLPADTVLDPPEELDSSAALAHSALTALVIGCSGAVAVGVATVAWQAARGGVDVRAALAFIAVAAALLLFRIRAHVDHPRRIALAAAGVTAASAAAALVAAVAPDRTGWAAVSLVAASAGADVIGRGGVTVRRVVDAIDGGCAVLLVPLTCWIAGAYTVARNWVFL